MSSFDSVRQDRLVGKLTMFDRMVFKGHMARLMANGALRRFLSSQRVPLKDFKDFVGQATADAWRYYKSAASAGPVPCAGWATSGICARR